MAEGHHSSSHIQCCNVLLILLGCVAVGLAASQFTRIGLDNYRLIDLRLLNVFHTLVGITGLLCVRGNHGSIVLKSIYILSIVISTASLAFYIDTLWRVVDTFQALSRADRAHGLISTATPHWDAFPGKIAVAAAMVLISALSLLVGLVALALLERMVMVERPWYRGTREDQIQLKYSVTQLTTVAALKFFVALAALALAVILEWQHQLLGGSDNYVKIALDHISSLLAFASALSDIYSTFNKRHSTLNFKVSTVLSIIAGVWCLKSVDNNMFPYYRTDINNYRMSLNLNQFTLPLARASTQYVTLIVHGCLIVSLCMLFLLCALSAIASASCWRENTIVVPPPMLAAAPVSVTTESYFPMSQQVQELHPPVYKTYAGEADMSSFLASSPAPRQSSSSSGCLTGSLHVFWAVCLAVMVVLGMVELPWSGDYVGGDMLWVAMLMFATGVLHSCSGAMVNANVRFVMNAIALGVVLEKSVLSVNLVYQSAAHNNYRNENVTDRRTYVGQIVLHSVQCLLLLGELLTALAGTFLHAGRLRLIRGIGSRGGGLLLCAALSSLLYAVVMSACYVLFELGKWRFAEVPLEVPFYRLANGPLAAVVFIVQVVAAVSPRRYLLSAALLQLVLASLALFVLSSAITNVYYMQVIIQLREQIGMGWADRLILYVALVLAALAVLACLLSVVAGLCYLLRASYIFHHLRNEGALFYEYYADGREEDGGQISSSYPYRTLHRISPMSATVVGPSPTTLIVDEASPNSEGMVDGFVVDDEIVSILTHPPHPGSPNTQHARGMTNLNMDYQLKSRAGERAGMGIPREARMGVDGGGIRLFPTEQRGASSTMGRRRKPTPPQSSELHQISIVPAPQEEQTVYWSAEENPHVYKSTRRFLPGQVPGTADEADLSLPHHYIQEGAELSQFSYYMNQPQAGLSSEHERGVYPLPSKEKGRARADRNDGKARMRGISAPESWTNGVDRSSVATQTNNRTVPHATQRYHQL